MADGQEAEAKMKAPAPFLTPGPVGKRGPVKHDLTQEEDLREAVRPAEDSQPTVQELQNQLAEAQAKLAVAERKASRKGEGVCSWTGKGNHEADKARILKNRRDGGLPVDAPMFVTRQETTEAYRRFARTTRLTPMMQPMAPPAPGTQQVVAEPRVGRRIDHTEA